MPWQHVSSSTHGKHLCRVGPRWRQVVPLVSQSSGRQKHMFPALLCSICCGTVPSDRHLQVTLIITDQPLAPLTSRFYRWEPFPPSLQLFQSVASPLSCVLHLCFCAAHGSFLIPEASFIGSNVTGGTWWGLRSGVAQEVVQIEEVRSPVGSHLLQQRRRHHISVINVVEEDH